MSFKDINILDTYESSTTDLIEEFYSPILAQSTNYDRIAGFFSSSSLAVAARGLAEFIDNGGHMRLITSPRLSSSDAAIFEKFVANPDSLSPEELGIDINNIEDEFTKNHVKAMGWMLQQGLLEIKLALVETANKLSLSKIDPSNSGIFHQKVGIFTDSDGNQISFSGSINESASAWICNDEEFKVFKAWDSTKNYFESDKNRFNEIWNNRRKNVSVFSLPTAVKNQLIEYSRDFDKETITLRHYLKTRSNKSFDFNHYKISLFEFQSKSLNQWKYRNHYRQLFEMATGCGKTRTAIAGVSHLLDTHERLVVIVSTPQNTLTKQWIDEFNNLDVSFDESCLIDGTNSKWRSDLNTIILRNNLGLSKHIAIFTTHTTASSKDFINIIKDNLNNYENTVFVGDETHWLGAPKLRNALLPEYNYRIGLSATPSRWFDDFGTKTLENYYGNNHFEFTIADALCSVNPNTQKHFLVKYYYNLESVELSVEEVVEYKSKTKLLRKLASQKEKDPNIAERYDRLLEQRANIIKNAEKKYDVLEGIIQELQSKNELEDLIIFVSHQQISRVLQILLKNNVICHKLTQNEGTKEEKKYSGKTERQFIIEKFKSKEYKAIVAIKCLDEGIDIPSACRGILMASSSNPREYIQRIGRIIRQDIGKNFSYLYDIYVDSIEAVDEEDREFETIIREKEKTRIREIAQNAINPNIATEILLK